MGEEKEEVRFNGLIVSAENNKLFNNIPIINSHEEAKGEKQIWKA